MKHVSTYHMQDRSLHGTVGSDLLANGVLAHSLSGRKIGYKGDQPE